MPRYVTGAMALTGCGLIVGTAQLAGARFQMAATASLLLALALVGMTKPSQYAFLASMSYMLAHMEFAKEIPGATVLSRSAALLILVVAYIRFRGREQPAQPRELTVVLSMGLSAYGLTFLIHGWNPDAFLAAGTLALSGIALSLLLVAVPGAGISRGIEAALAATLIVSIMWGVVLPGEGLEARRLEGIFSNANTLGFFAGLALVLAIVRAGRARSRYALLLIAAVAIVGSASRSALLAVLVAMVVAALKVLFSSERKTILAVTMVVALTGGIAAITLNLSGWLIFRRNASRGSGTDYALGIADSRPWEGVGYGATQLEVASTPLRWLAEVGILGFAAVVVAYLAVLILAWRRSWRTVTVAVFGVVSSLFEGWYFAGGSALFFTFWIAYISVVETSRSPLRDGAADSAAHSGFQPTDRARGRLRGPLPARGEPRTRMG